MSECDLGATTEKLSALAESRGCDLVEADDYTLLLDLDGGVERLALFQGQLEILNRNGVMPAYGDLDVWPSRSGGGYHVRIRLVEPLPVVTRLFFHAVLGSDLVKEALSYVRLVKEAEQVSVLFRPKVA